MALDRGRRGIALEVGLLVVGMLIAFALGPWLEDRGGAAEQPPKELFAFCPVGAQAGGCENPRGIAADRLTGHVYVGAITTRRISEFTPWGDFVKAFGWDVAPGAVNEQQEVRVRAAAGQFRLSFGASTTADLAYDATAEEVEAALNGLVSVSSGGGSVSVSGGPGGSSNGTSAPYVISFNGGPLAATDVAQVTAANGTTPLSGGTPSTLLEATTRANGTPGGAGFEACTAESGCKAGVNGAGGGQLSNALGLALDSAGDVYAVDQTNRRIQKFDSEGRFLRTWGWDVVSAGPGQSDEVQTIAVRATAGQFTLTFGANTTADIAFDAPAAAVQAALNALASISAGGGSVSVSGGPGNETGSSPYVVAFDGGPLAGTNVAQMTSANGTTPLSGGNPASGATITTTNPGATGFEICVAADGDTCKAGSTGAGQGQFGAWQIGSFISIDSADVVYVGDSNRIQKFSTTGAFLAEVPLPGEGFLKSLAVDSVGNLYTASQNFPTLVRKLSPAGAPICTITLTAPQALAADSDDNLYVVDGGSNPKVLKFDSSCGPLQTEWAGDGTFSASTAVATNICPGSEAPGNVYVANSTPASSLVRAFGTPPAGCELPPTVPPEIREQYAVSVDADSAHVRGVIDPRFWADTTYFVEYGTADCSLTPCEERVPVADLPLGSGVVEEDVTTADVFIEGLEPNTTYFYRLVAQSGGGGPVHGLGGTELADGAVASFTTTPSSPAAPQTGCPNQAFRTGPSAFLPDCRAYEMVSPVDKNGGDIEAEVIVSSEYVLPGTASGNDQSDGDGDGFTYSTRAVFGDAIGGPYTSQYLAHRDPGQSWSSHGISPPQENLPGVAQLLDGQFVAFSEDLSQAWLVLASHLSLGGCAPADSINLYRRFNDDSYEPLHCEPLPHKFNILFPTELQGTSADGCRAVFHSVGKFTADADPAVQTGLYQLYESNCEGPTRLVGRLPGGAKCALNNSSAGFDGGSINGIGRSDIVRYAFSADAHRLYWTCGSDLYLRTDPDLDAEGEPGEASVLVAAGARFQTASKADGATMLFTEAGSLKAYDAATATTTPLATGVQGNLLGTSDDANRAYFVSTAVLPGSGQNSEGDEAVGGANNLYMYQAGEGGPEFSFVGALGGLDMTQSGRIPGPVHKEPILRSSRVSPDGLHAAFTSTAPITGYDNTDLGNGAPDAEVFLFDAAGNGGAGEVVCASCNSTGARPVGRVVADDGLNELQAAAWIPGWTTQLNPTRVLSEDGRRLFFNSFEALVLRDTNGREDVYQWERVESEEECLGALGGELFVPDSGGCLSLISSGQDPKDSLFVEADRDGSDVFIRTGESLVSWDPGSVDIYDARAGGGLPPPPAPKPGCEGDACQSPPAPPALPTPSSLSATGPGDPRAANSAPGRRRCPKGKRRVMRAGKARCVRKGKRGSGSSKRRGQRHDGRLGV